MSPPLILRLVSAGVSVANLAGKIIRDVRSSGQLGIVDKGVNDLQTEADRSSQRSIVASFAHQFPDVTVIGEEPLDPSVSVKEEWIEKGQDQDVFKVNCPDELKDAKPEDIVIWVDPLDGTAEFTQGLLDHVTVLIGISLKGRSVAGIIHQPYYNYQNEAQPLQLGRTMWGIVGAGIYGLNQQIPPEGKRILTTTRSHPSPELSASLEALKPDDIIRVGGAGHNVLLLIEGKAHVYLFANSGCKKWDTCAPEALLHSIGGLMTDIHGSVYKYDSDVLHANRGGVLAVADEKHHQWYLERIPKTAKNSLIP